jgi:(4S)-4-hydroxy-5-phosphonooxypentane-2,3-dione isomerase
MVPEEGTPSYWRAQSTPLPAGLGRPVTTPTRQLRQEADMLAMWVKVRVKAEERERFLKAIEADAIGSEQDEPDCLRFNVLRDQKDPNVYYFFEVYRDEAALEAHRAAPHYAVWRAAADTLEGPPEATRCDTVFPAAAAYWVKRRSSG